MKWVRPIIFIVVHFLFKCNIGNELGKKRYITKDKLNLLSQGAGKELPEEFFQKKS